MGTRGIYGFYKDGEDKLSYNHMDSYPSVLGRDVVRFVEETSIEEMNEIFDRIQMVLENEEPSEIQIKRLEEYAKTETRHGIKIGEGTEKNWYNLLRSAQGDLFAFKDGLSFMIDSRNFIKESLFCEWGWIINLDDEVLEVYRGFNYEPTYHRYSLDEPYDPDYSDDKYYACERLIKFPLEDIPSDWEKQIEGRVE